VQKVDESLKADIMHWAAIYVRQFFGEWGELTHLTPHNRKIVCVSETKRYITWKLG